MRATEAAHADPRVSPGPVAALRPVVAVATRFDTLVAVAVFLAARAVSAVFLVASAPHQIALTDSPTYHVEGTSPAAPGYWQVITNWDGQWYETIARHGYPDDPSVLGPPAQRNPYAFSPLYPFLCRAVMAVTGAEFGVAGGLLSLAAGAVGCALLARWLVATRGRLTAHLAVAGLVCFPTAVLFQATYTESLALAVLVPTLRAIHEERWRPAAGLLVVLAVTRPILAPLALLLGLALLVALRHRDDPAARARVRPLTLLTVLAGACTLAWPVAVAVMTGVPTAYFDTMRAWVRAGGLGGGWVGGLAQLVGPALVALLVATALAFAVVRLRRPGRFHSPDGLGPWGASYLGYVLMTTTVNPSLARYALLTLVPVEPLRRVLTGPLDRAVRSRGRVLVGVGALLTVELAVQLWWVRTLFVVTSPVALPP